MVAIKVLAPEIAATSPARKRFLREAQASAAIRHEHVVSIYAVEESPIPYLVMEYIPGLTLQQRLDEKGPLDVLTVVRLGRQIAEGLAGAHAQDLIHRDIKPGNILLETSVHDRVKITDFGLARAADDASLTQSGTIAGTPMYMAPEQALGHKLDQRADLFSFGSVLYQMVSGRPPFRAPTMMAVLKRVTEDTPRPIREIIPETPQWLCDIITKLHAKNPDERYQSAREIADVLANCESQFKTHSGLKDFSLIPRAKVQPAGWWKTIAVAALVCPMLALGLYALNNRPVAPLKVTEVAPLEVAENETTPKQPVPDPIKPDNALMPNQVTEQGVPKSDGWVQLFNGKNLTGWKFHPNHLGDWEVRDGILRGSTRQSHLFSERGDYGNFHLRAEVKVNLGGDSGILFRAPFELRRGRTPIEFGIPGCYEAELHQNRSHARPTGSISAGTGDAPPTTLGQVIDRSLTQPDEWFTIEVIAENNHFITKINGIEAANCNDSFDRYRTGHLALQVWHPNTLVQFRKIEIRELLPTPTPQEPPPTFKNTIGMEFVIVPKGKSWLGGGKDKPGDQEVEIPADFYLGKYEVTQEEWEKVMGENPSHYSRTGGGMDKVKDISDADLKRFPVERVSWDDCQVFVTKLNELEKEAGWVYRLPKLTEWEYACRGGPMSYNADSAFEFYFSKPTNTLLPGQSNFGNDQGLNRTCKVGSYEPNRLGLLDLHGNVWEWCADEVDDNNGASLRVLRGGGWSYSSEYCQAAGRGSFAPSHGDSYLGLRLARVRSGAPSPEAKTPPPAVGPFTDADVQRIAALPAAEQVEEVRKELMRRNPGFDGTLKPTIENDAVTEISFNSDAVENIAPVRALTKLVYLDCRGTYPNEGKLSDLSPIKGMKVSRIDCSSTQIADLSLRWPACR